MAVENTGRFHPTAVISPEAQIADDVQVGAFAVVEGPVRIGEGCVIGPGAHLFGPLTMGRHNQVHSHAVLGEQPQHLKYAGEPTRLEIGDNNIFREGVTVHRGTTATWTTRIGNNNFLMANAHVAHDCLIGNNCILANGALVAGHCVVEDNVFLSGNCAVHQFVRVGRLALLSGCSGTTKDIPPFVIQQNINLVAGVNVVGMRRAGIPVANIDAVRRSFHRLYRENEAVPEALNHIAAEMGDVPEVAELVSFIRGSTRGVILRYAREAA